LGCAAGLASLALLKKETLARLPELESVLSEELRTLLPLPIVGSVRQAGMMAGIDITRGGARAGNMICALAKKEGLLIRPLGNTLVLIPPLSMKENEIRRMVLKLKKAIRAYGSA
jgi:adenosylmethionine-8-amino-7-oxononanoate aminotransferase